MSTLALEINDRNVLLIQIYVVNVSIAEAYWFVKNKVSPRQRGTFSNNYSYISNKKRP